MTIFASDTTQAAAGLTPLFFSPARFIGRREEPRKARMKEIFQVRPAQMSDMNSIIGLIDEAAGWLASAKGTDQWQRPWPDRPARDQRIRRGIKVGRTWIVEDPSEPADNPRRLVGTVSCGRGGNKKLWTQRERNEPRVHLPAHRQPAARGPRGRRRTDQLGRPARYP